MWQACCIVIGIMLVAIGLVVPSTIALVVGVVFCALGGVFLFILDGDWFD